LDFFVSWSPGCDIFCCFIVASSYLSLLSCLGQLFSEFFIMPSEISCTLFICPSLVQLSFACLLCPGLDIPGSLVVGCCCSCRIPWILLELPNLFI
jgi:hypothetical protein